jgi:hypothetical protein
MMQIPYQSPTAGQQMSYDHAGNGLDHMPRVAGADGGCRGRELVSFIGSCGIFKLARVTGDLRGLAGAPYSFGELHRAGSTGSQRPLSPMMQIPYQSPTAGQQMSYEGYRGRKGARQRATQ